MKFIVDAQLPPALCRWLFERGHDAEHVFDVGLVGTADEAIANYAEANGLFVVSKDQDFLILKYPDRFGLLWLRCGNTTNRALVAWLDRRWSRIEELLAAGERVIEVQ
jgi:predicted nuclease of predicted toxin-antitoxin system